MRINATECFLLYVCGHKTSSFIDWYKNAFCGKTKYLQMDPNNLIWVGRWVLERHQMTPQTRGKMPNYRKSLRCTYVKLVNIFVYKINRYYWKYFVTWLPKVKSNPQGGALWVFPFVLYKSSLDSCLRHIH